VPRDEGPLLVSEIGLVGLCGLVMPLQFGLVQLGLLSLGLLQLLAQRVE
jgi:hypothetical protein